MRCRRYPNTPEEFRQSRLPGVFDSTRAGKRMKLPTPETWETQVSLKGNKAATWESLIGAFDYWLRVIDAYYVTCLVCEWSMWC